MRYSNINDRDNVIRFFSTFCNEDKIAHENLISPFEIQKLINGRISRWMRFFSCIEKTDLKLICRHLVRSMRTFNITGAVYEEKVTDTIFATVVLLNRTYRESIY